MTQIPAEKIIDNIIHALTELDSLIENFSLLPDGGFRISFHGRNLEIRISYEETDDEITAIQLKIFNKEEELLELSSDSDFFFETGCKLLYTCNSYISINTNSQAILAYKSLKDLF
jgi:hypothetical protein